MQKKPRQGWLSTFTASVSTLTVCCALANSAMAFPHYYTYAEPDEDAPPPQQQHYTYVAPSADAVIDPAYYPAILRKAAKEKPNPALTYPPIETLHAAAPAPVTVTAAQTAPPAVPPRKLRAAVQPSPASVPLNTALVNIIEAHLASAAMLAQMSVQNAAAYTSAEVPQLALANGPVGNGHVRTYTMSLSRLAPAAGTTQVASASSTLPPLPVATLGAVTPVPSTLAPPSAIKPVVMLSANEPSLSAVTPSAGTGLSAQSREIIDKLPPEKTHAVAKHPVAIDHFRKPSLEEDAVVKEHDGIGIKMSIRRPKLDVNQMLENAYQALIAGNQEEAIEIYKQVLDDQPQNKLALFGLATTYHRAGQTNLARPLYGKLLAIDPTNVEGFNNFLVLLSDENPAEALAELKKLEKTHPGFSPIPAQEAVIYEKTGQYDKAATAMDRAIELSPENLKYRYDMAIILDKQGAWADAANYYQQLLTASERGEKIPSRAEEIQERLTFIRSNKLKGTS